MEHLPLWIVFGGYALFTLGIAYGWWRALFRSRRKMPAASVPATVVVPFRSEATRLDPLTESIKQAAPQLPGWEFIFVNDHSEDESVSLLNATFAGFPQVRVLELPAGESGKKAAIRLGIAASNHPYIITTDADCRLSVPALQHMAARLAYGDTQLVCGPVLQHSANNMGGRFTDLEFLSLMGSGIAFWGMGMPMMGNGAFLGFRKEAFRTVNGFEGNEEHPGGDDVFLLHKIRERFGNKDIRFLTGADDVVPTAGDGSWIEFLQRRTRWGAKARAYQGSGPKAITFFTLLVQSAAVVCVMGLLLSGRFRLLLWALGLKLLCDTIVLVPMIVRFRRWELLPFILPASPLHPFYLLFTAFFSLRGRYEWKRRDYRS